MKYERECRACNSSAFTSDQSGDLGNPPRAPSGRSSAFLWPVIMISAGCIPPQMLQRASSIGESGGVPIPGTVARYRADAPLLPEANEVRESRDSSGGVIASGPVAAADLQRLSAGRERLPFRAASCRPEAAAR